MAYFEVLYWLFSAGSDEKPQTLQPYQLGVLRLTGYGPALWAIIINRSPAEYESESSPLLSQVSVTVAGRLLATALHALQVSLFISEPDGKLHLAPP